MIPNAGLDNCAAYSPWVYVTGNLAAGSGTEWLAFAAISEDSSTPSSSDTGIGSEVMRTNATGGFARTVNTIRNGSTNRIGISIERTYVFAISGNYNITKYGYVPLNAGGNFSWIDLTRADPNDPMSSPVTLTVVPGDEVQLWQTQTITVPWSVDLEPFIITGTAGNDAAGTHDAYCGFYSTSDTLGEVTNNDVTTASGGIGTLIRDIFWPSNGPGMRVVATPQTPQTARDAALAASNAGQEQGENPVLTAYASGTFYRDKNLKFTTAQANTSITGIAINRSGATTGSANASHGFKIVFDDPAAFVKDNLHELTLTFRVSWAEG